MFLKFRRIEYFPGFSYLVLLTQKDRRSPQKETITKIQTIIKRWRKEKEETGRTRVSYRNFRECPNPRTPDSGEKSRRRSLESKREKEKKSVHIPFAFLNSTLLLNSIISVLSSYFSVPLARNANPSRPFCTVFINFLRIERNSMRTA
ncbi:hypothetical protein HZH66_013420 [Vespula vulgaris]|uniref:Uncharacterized protein n=1 Tax=Vespula vulgaris TaxID=7454 RepID=A0A834J4Y4_VESVU|nr:hypothetical protein HZH66_013420 [Vespula vulgaris]